MMPPARVSSNRRRSASVTSGPGSPNINCRPTRSSSVGALIVRGSSSVQQVRPSAARELVGRPPPAEAPRLSTRLDDQGEVGEEWLEARPIGDVHLDAPAELTAILVKRRLEGRGTKGHARQPAPREGGREPATVEKGRPHQLERSRGAAALRQIG